MSTKKKAKNSAGDVSDKTRTFVVYVDRNVPGLDAAEETVVVAPGEDAEEICAEVAATLLANEVDCGWYEKE